MLSDEKTIIGKKSVHCGAYFSSETLVREQIETGKTATYGKLDISSLYRFQVDELKNLLVLIVYDHKVAFFDLSSTALIRLFSINRLSDYGFVLIKNFVIVKAWNALFKLDYLKGSLEKLCVFAERSTNVCSSQVVQNKDSSCTLYLACDSTAKVSFITINL